MKVSVIGMGYIGLPTSALIASNNIDVIGVDINKSVVKKINAGETHIVEKNLDKLVKEVVESGRLRASYEYEAADIFIIAVPTPINDNNEPNISFVENAAVEISKVIKKGDLIILESTSSVGTTEKILKLIKKNRNDLVMPNSITNLSISSDIKIAYCPERVLPGNILNELVSNDRVIGGISKECSIAAMNFYNNFVKGKCFLTNSKTAELCKLVENSYRDVNIGFANELSVISDKLDIDVWELVSLANRHPRVNILDPGPGVGGHCIAVDPYFIIDSCPDESVIISAAREVNNSKPKFVLEKVEEAILKTNKPISDITICCLGIAFKPNIDDLRQSPALDIVLQISKMPFKQINIVEPNIDVLPTKLNLENINLDNLSDAIKNSDILLMLVHHDEFLNIKKEHIHSKAVVDTRGTLTPI
jgi:UDP-N-acetyl-D-mannosaminuronic acid dehydrogenase